MNNNGIKLKLIILVLSMLFKDPTLTHVVLAGGKGRVGLGILKNLVLNSFNVTLLSRNESKNTDDLECHSGSINEIKCDLTKQDEFSTLKPLMSLSTLGKFPAKIKLGSFGAIARFSGRLNTANEFWLPMPNPMAGSKNTTTPPTKRQVNPELDGQLGLALTPVCRKASLPRPSVRNLQRYEKTHLSTHYYSWRFLCPHGQCIGSGNLCPRWTYFAIVRCGSFR